MVTSFYFKIELHYEAIGFNRLFEHKKIFSKSKHFLDLICLN